MSNAGVLNDRPKTELAKLASRRGIRGWESMNKGELVKALSRPASKPAGKPSRPSPTVKPAKPAARATTKPAAKPAVVPLPKPAAKSAAKVTRPATAPTASRIAGHVSPTNGTAKPAVKLAAAKPEAGKNGSAKPAAKAPPVGGPSKDRIFIAVPDPHWLHVIWELTAQSVQRAEAALKQDWYGAKLIIRLSDVTSHDTTSTSETPIRDIVIEGDCNTWYINVPQPPRQYRADIGYVSRRGDFFPLAKSNVATPPKAGSSEALDPAVNLGDAKQAERTLARSTGFESAGNPELREYFEERLKRSLGAPKETGFGSGATPPGALKKFFFDIDARLVVYGRTDPTAHLTLGNDPVSLKPDGTFAMWFSLPDSRQIIPAVATSSDGVEERTIVLAVERNTKYLDPMIHDHMNDM
ncbi:Uncharacterized protein OS=Singulisphaera acidiphila (strain ATCC BAA-1392 / DSM 18658 / VKM B-2454 / MOB10) GN=Sinac_6872 PE=4 SV=1 [Gemmataceae bacterium]|nr:Uncharacterized protein OS=Singulisphaera acidiphila (strain ATCC BAA-1392 / DSM 18658 / VKM B-2454 / MOB10) GN=Sinac_6872 PE=4 SV=1 [Gemmataceae bacterium]VTT97670.1 Uncharacterized protein OS=Singulisphaera acidiphila (strain ATCC BAA-1392 / DSM 18658 / VKM B-2454 / MOB10) GN=Sinac_6872 PE=4 SV=1 [Gemmataceae bacterium]